MSPDETRLAMLAEQRHDLMELDADSQCTDIEGCVCVACPGPAVSLVKENS